MINWTSLKLIAFYQKFISPKKGFRCAYGVLNNTHGCSGFVKKIINEKGLLAGRYEIRAQFENCRLAAIKLKKKNGCKKRKRDCKENYRGCKNSSCEALDCGFSSCDVTDCGSLDCGSCDVGSCN